MTVMKKFVYNIAIAAAAACMAASCSPVDDFLNVDPSKNTDRSVKTTDQLEAIIVNYGDRKSVV